MAFSLGLPCYCADQLGNRQFRWGRRSRSAGSPVPGNRLIAGEPAAMSPVDKSSVLGNGPEPGALARGEGSDVTMLLQEVAKKGL